MKQIYKDCLKAVIVLSVADVLCTYGWVCKFGVEIEGNPVVGFFIRTFGAEIGLAVCLAFTIAGVAILWRYGSRLVYLYKVLIVLVLLSRIGVVMIHMYGFVYI